MEAGKRIDKQLEQLKALILLTTVYPYTATTIS